MHDFKYKNGELFCESVKVRSIVQKVGTPCYIYSHHTLVDHFTKIRKAFATLDHEARVSYANEPARQLLACGVEPLLGRRLWSEPPQPAGERLQLVCRQALDSGEPAEFEAFVETLDKWIEVRLYPFDEGLALYLRDVSQRRQIQEQLLLLQALKYPASAWKHLF